MKELYKPCLPNLSAEGCLASDKVAVCLNATSANTSMFHMTADGMIYSQGKTSKTMNACDS